jgi:hypothetical protein
MAKRKEYEVVTGFLTRSEFVRSRKVALRPAIAEAARLAKSSGERVHVVKQGASGQAYEAVCEPRSAHARRGDAARWGGGRDKLYAKCTLWSKTKKKLKASKRALYRTRAKYG